MKTKFIENAVLDLTPISRDPVYELDGYAFRLPFYKTRSGRYTTRGPEDKGLGALIFDPVTMSIDIQDFEPGRSDVEPNECRDSTAAMREFAMRVPINER